MENKREKKNFDVKELVRLGMELRGPIYNAQKGIKS